jgi:putative methyltransferase (TIGR04325 family)
MEEFRQLKRIFAEIPLLWDLYAYFWTFHRRGGSHRGIYESFEAAAAACPKPERHGRDQNEDGVAELAAIQKIGSFDPRDYPLMVWLGRAFEDSTTVFDLGGSIGLGYYAYGRFIHYPASLRWIVCEVPQMCRTGRRIASERKAADLEFTEKFSRADGMDIFLSCGTLQCLDLPFLRLFSTLKRKPKHILLQRVPLGNNPTFYTIQKSDAAQIHPYRIENRQEMFNGLAVEGYRLVDEWKDSKTVKIPFYPRRKLDGYCGAYFQRQK